MPQPKPTPRRGEQSKAFIEKARELGCSEDEGTFEKTIKKIASAPPPKSVEKRKTKKPAQ